MTQFIGGAPVSQVADAELVAAGVEPSGWPRLTGHWQASTPSIGDLDDEGHVDVVQTTRLGELFVWRTAGATCQADQRRTFPCSTRRDGTSATDTRRPACILDLRACGNVTLRWTAVGDDGRCGTATAYELRLRAHHTHELRERHADRDLTARARWDPGVTDVPAAGRRRLLRAPRGGQNG